ncbi:MAG: hypothetical protein ACP5GJ_02155 [Nanopusillaceae archaeon]|jgi:hypothetical protein
MDKNKEIIITAITLLALLGGGFIIAPFLYPIFNSQNINLNQNQIYQIYQIEQYCQSLCLYAKYNLSVQNLLNSCLSSPNSILYNYWISAGVNNWGCEVSENYSNLCNINNYIVLDNNCNIIGVFYNNKQLNIT